MDLPSNVELKNSAHGSGAKGLAWYRYEDTAGLGIRMEARRESAREAFVETWFLDVLPDRSFPTFAALRVAALDVSAAQASAVMALYPRIEEVHPDRCGNRCRLCPRPPAEPGQARQHHDTWRVTLAHSWKDADYLSLCAQHLAQFEGDPAGLKVAVAAELAERRARADTEGLPW